MGDAWKSAYTRYNHRGYENARPGPKSKVTLTNRIDVKFKY